MLLFLIAPLLVVVPLSFNAEPYFTFTDGMLRLDPDAWSLRWYRSVAEDREWHRALANSLVIGIAATALTTLLGTLAALGLSNPAMPGRSAITALLISPMITPLIISAVGMFFFYSAVGLAQTHLGLILAHATLGAPFVVITVTASLAGFDRTLLRAATSLGAGPLTAFRRIQLPLIAPGVVSGRCSRSPPRSTRWSPCCSSAVWSNAPCRGSYGRASARRSVRRSWRWRRSCSCWRCCSWQPWSGCARAAPARQSRPDHRRRTAGAARDIGLPLRYSDGRKPMHTQLTDQQVNSYRDTAFWSCAGS